MAFIGGTPQPPKRTFKAPGHVSALGLLAILCLIGGVVLILTEDVVAGLVGLFQCCALLIMQAVAEDAAYARWRLDEMARELEVVISDANARNTERIIARQKREVEEAEQLRKQREAEAAAED